MSEVTRYDLTEDVTTGVIDVTPVPDTMEGRFVSYEDYLALKERFDFKQNLTEQIVELQKQRDALAAEFWLTRHLVPDDVAVPNIKDVLNAIRAEGVELLTGRLQQAIDEGVFDTKEIGVAAGAVYEGAQIAAQLRAGEPS